MTDNTKNKWLLFDWGNTLMKVFPDQTGPMKSWTKLEVMAYVPETLRILNSRWRIAVATNAEDSSEDDIREVLMKVNIINSIDKIYCYRSIGYKKPSPEFFHYILNDLQISADNLIMIGDDLTADLEGAEKSGIRGILYNPELLPVPGGKTIPQFNDFSNLYQLLKTPE